MATTGDFLGPLKGVGSSIITWTIIGIVGLVVLTALGFLAVWAYRRKKWNLRVEIKLPRSDGKIINSEKAKGHYSVKEGIVDIKRKGLKAIGMEPFDVRKYLQGEKYLEVIQLGPEQYIPILPKSYLTIKEEGEDKGKTILEIEADIPKRRTWKNYFERVAKDRFTLLGFLQKYGQVMAFGVIIFLIFIGFSILWMRMPGICGG